MWKPADRIKWKADQGVVPDLGAVARSRLFEPLNAGRLQLRNRTWVPAMVPWRATEDGEVTDNVLDWYGRFARGRPAAIVVEATGIRDVPSGPLMRIGHDRYLDGLRRLVQRVKAESDGQTRLFIQLIDFLAIRRRPDRARFLGEFLKITRAHHDTLSMENDSEAEVREQMLAMEDDALRLVLTGREWESLNQGYRERVTDTHLAHIRELPDVMPELFAAAARRAEHAGFDGVELHYAHAYTMASFLSATNTRTDGYGGDAEARVRLPLEVFAAVRDAVSDRFVVGSRFLAEECIEGGSTVEDSALFARNFAEAGMDFISLSRGGKFDDAKRPRVGEAAYPYTGPSGYECMPQYLSDRFGPFGRNFSATAAIRQSVREAGFETPIVGAGGIHNFDMAEGVLCDGVADVVATARQSLADPDWVRKLETGHGDQVCTCEYTNYCEGLDQKHKQVTCQLWDRTDRDKPGVALSHDGKRRLVAPDWQPAASEEA